MKIQTINSQTNFNAKNFKIKSNKMQYTYTDTGYTFFKNMYWAKEYSNPKAEELYNRAMQTKDLKQKTELFKEMGHYKMLIYGTGLIGFIRKLLDKPKTFI